MEWIQEFLNSERSLYLSAGIIGINSVIVGLFFLIFSNHKSFAISMIIMGSIEMTVMLPIYLKYPQKVRNKISSYKTNKAAFLKSETRVTQKALKSFFQLKLSYGLFIIALIIGMYFLNPKSMFTGIFIALILHLSFAICINNFGKIHTKKYLQELVKSPK